MTEQPLAAFLRQSGLLSAPDLDRLLQQANEQSQSLWDRLVLESVPSEAALADGFAERLALPRVRVARVPPEPEVIALVPEKVARRHTCVPLSRDGRTLVLAVANPLNYEAVQDVEFVSALTVRPVVATRTEILDSIEQCYATSARADGFLSHVSDVRDFALVSSESAAEPLGSPSDAGIAPVVKLCNLILHGALQARASDIHIEPALHGVQVRLRIDGVLCDFMPFPKWLHAPVVSRLKILGRLDIAERRLPQDGQLRVQYQGRSVDVRLSTLPSHFGEKVVMRLLSGSAAPSMDSLGFPDDERVAIDAALHQPQGLIIVSGPTGSGKTTTLHAAVAARRAPEVNIVTVEDPIEYHVDGITQVQVDPRAGLTFATSLRSILRQDPDVILIGEIRDAETATIAFESALTGHLVLTTVHANSALATIGRLLELGVDASLLANGLTLVLAQRLARRICALCREPAPPDPALLQRLRLQPAGVRNSRGRGCPACNLSGFKGRVAVHELLRVTPTLREAIGRRAPMAELRRIAEAAGMRSLVDRGVELVRAGVTSLEEIARVIQIDDQPSARCGRCGAEIELDFSTCPHCAASLRRGCGTCGQSLKLEWKVCPYCSVPASLPTCTAAAAAPPAQPEIESEGGSAPPAPLELEERVAFLAPVPPIVPPAASSPSPAPTASSGDLALPAKVPRILIVDDHEDMATAARALLLAGIRVRLRIEVVRSGADALASVGRNVPDLVITDVAMPGMDGFELCERLRADVRTAFVPIMMMTGSRDEANRSRAHLVGTDDYVTKPLLFADFTERVNRLLRRSYGL